MDLHYGNIAEDYLHYLEQDNLFTKHFENFSNVPYANALESVEEIKHIQDVQKASRNSNNWDSIKKFCIQWDGDLIDAFDYWLKKMDIPCNDEYLEYLNSVSEEVGGLIIKLKDHYNRPRPFQVAYYTNKGFHPMETISGNTPAYPSGHATQSYLLCSLIAHHYEEKRDELMKLAGRIAETRIIMGVHYKSDNDFGIEIAKKLMDDDAIKEKYFS